MVSRSAQSRLLALSRVDLLIGKAFSVVALISGLEMAANALPQASYLNALVMWCAVGLILAVQAFNVWNFWFWRAATFGYLIHALLVAALLLFWPLQVRANVGVPEESRPWLWWATGIASMAMGWFIQRWWSWVFIGAMPFLWAWVHAQPSGGYARWETLLQDSSYILLFPSTVIAITQMLRSAANRVDRAAELATVAAVARAQTDARERERSRIEALVHDSVLTTLLVAANASTSDQSLAAARSAESAIAKLRAAAFENQDSQNVSVLAFFQALSQAALRLDPGIQTKISGSSDRLLGPDLVAALTDATAQAVTNSIQHAGRGASRLLRLKATAQELKIVVKDDGLGFWVSRVPKNRLGLRLSIIERVESVGGKVFIDTKPGGGTSIVMEWPFDD
jgi:signal transduction histidine kinase